MLTAMRTTIRLPDDLLKEAKELAVLRETTLTTVIEEALREALLRRKQGREETLTSLTTFGQGGLKDGIDLDDSAALRELLEDAW